MAAAQKATPGWDRADAGDKHEISADIIGRADDDGKPLRTLQGVA